MSVFWEITEVGGVLHLGDGFSSSGRERGCPREVCKGGKTTRDAELPPQCHRQKLRLARLESRNFQEISVSVDGSPKDTRLREKILKMIGRREKILKMIGRRALRFLRNKNCVERVDVVRSAQI